MAQWIDPAPFEAAGFAATFHNEGGHLVLARDDLKIDCWPVRGGGHKWMAFLRVFETSPEAVLSAVNRGRLVMPIDYDSATCRSCDAPIWWGKSKRGKSIPLDADGGVHFLTCSARAA